MTGEEEVFFTCPHCFQEISFVIELNYTNQEYVEDCEVCCRPIQVKYSAFEGELADFQVSRS